MWWRIEGMTDEPKDSADLLVAAARTASREGMIRDQFIHAAKCFWDSWHEARAFMDAPEPKGCPWCGPGFGPCKAEPCEHPLFMRKG